MAFIKKKERKLKEKEKVKIRIVFSVCNFEWQKPILFEIAVQSSVALSNG